MFSPEKSRNVQRIKMTCSWLGGDKHVQMFKDFGIFVVGIQKPSDLYINLQVALSKAVDVIMSKSTVTSFVFSYCTVSTL